MSWEFLVLCPVPFLPLFLFLCLRNRFILWQMRQLTHKRSVGHQSLHFNLVSDHYVFQMVHIALARPVSMLQSSGFNSFFCSPQSPLLQATPVHLICKLPPALDLLSQRNFKSTHSHNKIVCTRVYVLQLCLFVC